MTKATMQHAALDATGRVIRKFNSESAARELVKELKARHPSWNFEYKLLVGKYKVSSMFKADGSIYPYKERKNKKNAAIIF